MDGEAPGDGKGALTSGPGDHGAPGRARRAEAGQSGALAQGAGHGA